MGELLDAVVNWRIGLVVLLVFGFAPGAVLRLIALAYHRDDPRRSEMLAELYTVPWLERPLWVAQHLERALFEGLWERITWAATGRIIHRWHLGSGVERNRQYPETFEIPDEEAKQAVEPGVLVKLMFEMRNPNKWFLGGERMWVEVVAVKRRQIVGRLINEPLGLPRLYPGDKVKFTRDHIIDIHWKQDDSPAADPEGHQGGSHWECDDSAADSPERDHSDDSRADDPQRDDLKGIHRECNGLCQAVGDPQLSPPESFDRT
jgi:Uncharacterized protein conserved in bacteria (DUF2314)